MKFLHISDTHYLINNPGNLYGVSYEPNNIFEDFLKNHDFTVYDFIVHTGDIISDGNETDYAAFKGLMSEYIPDEIPIYYVLGNHDKREAFYNAFNINHSENKYYYSINHQGYRLVFLDTLVEGDHAGSLGTMQENWVIEELKKPSKNGTLIFQHHPYEIGWHENEIELTVSNDYQNAIRASDCIGFFSGHLHMGQSSIVYGKPQFSANSLAFGISLRKDRFMRNNRLGYQIVSVDKDIIKYYPEISYPLVTDYQEEVKVVDLQAGK